MSIIAYREWEIWQNMNLFASRGNLHGYYIFHLTPALMLGQTIQFLHEMGKRGALGIDRSIDGFLRPFDNSLDVLQKQDAFDTSTSTSTVIDEKLQEIRALSMCLDFPLNCNYMEFVDLQQGKVFMASRKPIGRGLAFEIKERGHAAGKITQDYQYYSQATRNMLAAQHHYLSGLTLLSLEDSYSGLIDAAFMQFYQGCEILCGNNYKENEAKKHVASTMTGDIRLLQIVIHHVWQVRHNFFGHGNVGNHVRLNTDTENTYHVAKQVLVARRLCRTLIDLASPSGVVLAREMRFYCDNTSEEYQGTVAELETNFKVDYPKRRVDIFDGQRNLVETYVIK